MLRSLVRTYRTAFAGLPRRVWLLALVTLVNRAGTMVLPFMSLYLTQELELATGTAGVILSLYGVGSVVGSLVGGWASDRLGPVRVMELSFLATGLGFLGLAGLRSTASVAVGVLLVSVVAEAFRPSIMAATALSSPAEVRTRSLAMIRLAANLGMAVGPAVGGILATHRYAWLFVGDALTCWAAGVLVLATLHPREPLAGAGAGSRPAAAVASPWRDGPFLAFALLMVALAMVFFQIFSTFPLYLRGAYGLGEARIGALLGCNAAVIVAVEMVLLKKLEGRSPMRMTGLGALLVCLGLAALPLGSTAWFALACLMVLTLGEMLALPLANAVAAHRAPAAASGRYMGVYMLSYSVAFIVAPAAGTAIYESLGPRVLWFGIGTLGVVLWLAFTALSSRLEPH